MTRAEREERRLLGLLREAGVPIPDGSTLHRVHTNPAQRRDGAWAWTVRAPGGRWLDVGSQWPRRQLLAGVDVSSPTVYNGNAWHVFPAAEPRT